MPQRTLLRGSLFQGDPMPPTLYLIDGHALAYRTYYAITAGASGAFQTRQGEPTAGVYGFASVLLRLLEQEHPQYLAIAFDAGRTFRDEIFPDYKGTRAKMPDELRPQIERIRQLVDAFNIPRLEVEGYEADDVLGSVARQAVQQGLGVKIITGDRDLLQLVDERIVVTLPGKNLSEARDFFPKDVLETLGVRPDQIVDYKALVGDKSDNIPGVAGVGEKTAVELLRKYETLDGIYAHLDELPAALRKRLENGKEAAYLSRKLAAIVTDLPLTLNLEQARVASFDPAQVEALFRQLEFRSLMPRLNALVKTLAPQPPQAGRQLALFEGQAAASLQVGEPPPLERQVTIIDTPEALESLVRHLEGAACISLDTETTSTDPMRASLVGLALATQPGSGFYLPLGHQGEGLTQLTLEQALEALRRPLGEANTPKVGHNLKYDYVVLKRHGLTPAPLTFDTMIAEWLSNPASRNLGLKNLAWVRQNIKMTPIEELIGKGKKQRSMADLPIPLVAAYAVADVEVVLRLMPELERELEERQAISLLREIEMPLLPVLAEMEIAGVALDVPFLQQMSLALSERLAALEQQVFEQVGQPFNLNSPQQLSEALFKKLGIAPPDRSAKTATGFYSTSADILESLRGQHPVVDWVLEYRELSKLKSTYVDALPLQVNPLTGRVHTSFSQTGSVTGRLASSDPNLQNIPIRSEVGRQVRRAFIAAPEHVLLGADYSQIELRIVAHMADDQNMLAAFHAGQDIHAATAAAIFGVPIESVDSQQRRRAKAINFGLIYGMSPYGLSRYADITLAEAEDFVEAYFRQFPGVKAYLDRVRRLAAEQGYVETLLGRRRYFPALKHLTDRNQRNREEREAINAPIQGTAADIIKIAMVRLPPALRSAGLSARLILQVHDELVLECPQAELHPTAALVQEVMSQAYPLKVPLSTDVRWGVNWGDMQPL